MFKKLRELASATVAVVRNKDIDRPVKKRKKTKTEIEKFNAIVAKEKEIATSKDEPWFKLIDMDIDYNTLTGGSFEFDWNEQFIIRLVRLGYVGKEDGDLVDQWFTDVCRNVVLETYEQEQADPQNRKLENGRREYR